MAHLFVVGFVGCVAVEGGINKFAEGAMKLAKGTHGCLLVLQLLCLLLQLALSLKAFLVLFDLPRLLLWRQQEQWHNLGAYSPLAVRSHNALLKNHIVYHIALLQWLANGCVSLKEQREQREQREVQARLLQAAARAQAQRHPR